MVGSIFPDHKKGEKFDNGNWTDIEEAPVRTRFAQSAVVFTAGNFYYFGGLDKGTTLSSILCLNATTWTWSKVGKLNSARYSNGVILVEDTFMVLGGSGRQQNEACRLKDGKFICEEKTSKLENYYNNALLFLVKDNYGNC